jgi:Effector-associated domain 9
MNRTLAEHIQDLEHRLNLISSQMMREDNPKKRNNLESELRAVESALTQYRSAFEVESRLSGSSYSQ